jgi:hypothetical protein
MFSWRPNIVGADPLSRDGQKMLDTGAHAVYDQGVIVADGGIVHFVGLGIAEGGDCTGLCTWMEQHD